MVVIFKIPGWIFNKTVWLVLESQTRNFSIMQEAARRATWSLTLSFAVDFWISKFYHKTDTDYISTLLGQIKKQENATRRTFVLITHP